MLEGDLVGGKYRIGRVLGSGAMGTVYAAQDTTLGRKVAIKVLKPDALGHEDAIGRFFVEARSAAQLTSDHAVKIYEVARLEDGTPYIVMEYLSGCDLSVWLRRHAVIPISQAVDFVLHACDAIAEAHERGIIHRDVKPANLFAVDRGNGSPRVKVLDFGISKMEALVGDTLPPELVGPAVTPTKRSDFFGSLQYMSPEQMQSAKDVDGRTDVWSLGVTLWELLTGHLPFSGQNLIGLYSTIVSGARPRMRDARKEVPAELESVVLRCFATKRDERYATVRELVDALAPFGSAPTSQPPESPPRQRPGLLVEVTTRSWALRFTVGVALLSAVATLLVVRQRTARTPVPSPESHAAATLAPPPSTPAAVGISLPPSPVPQPVPPTAPEPAPKPTTRPPPERTPVRSVSSTQKDSGSPSAEASVVAVNTSAVNPPPPPHPDPAPPASAETDLYGSRK